MLGDSSCRLPDMPKSGVWSDLQRVPASQVKAYPFSLNNGGQHQPVRQIIVVIHIFFHVGPGREGENQPCLAPKGDHTFLRPISNAPTPPTSKLRGCKVHRLWKMRWRMRSSPANSSSKKLDQDSTAWQCR